MLQYLTGAFYFFRSLAEESVFLLPILLGMALVFGKRERKALPQEWKCFWTFAVFALVMRCLLAAKFQNISRYYQLPGVFLIAVAAAGYWALVERFARWRWGRVLCVLVAIGIAGAAAGKALHPPKSKPYIAEACRILSESTEPGCLFVCSDSVVRFVNMLPGWEICEGTKNGSTDPIFWREFLKFVQLNQGNGKALYLLLREPVEEPETQFRDACRREWGFEPFTLIWEHRERGMRFQLYRCRFVSGLFGLPGVTRGNPNPYGLKLPEKIKIDHTQDVSIVFDDILKSNPFAAWGGVEFRAPVGKCFDDRWTLLSKETCPEEFPISVMLYLPNGWPVGYAEAVVSTVAGETLVPRTENTPHPAVDNRLKPPYWNPELPEFAFALHKVAAGELEGNIFWIGSRCNGTRWLTDKLAKRHEKLKIRRLEDCPVLPHSKDARYCFADLAFKRGRVNPLLKAEGEPDWTSYARKEGIPEDALIVLALGYEEIHFMGWRSAFHIDTSIEALRRFSASVMRGEHPAKVLLILPVPSGDKDKDWCGLSSNPYLYGFRWHKFHCLKRLVEGIMQVQKEFPELVILPAQCRVPAGKDERYPDYLPAIESYLSEMLKK